MQVHYTCLWTGGESPPHGGPCTFYTGCGCVNSLIQRRECRRYMHSGVLVYARPLHKMLPPGHVWLLLVVGACRGNAWLVRGGVAVGQQVSDPPPWT